jgi:Ni/Co efflux regulator RcnB
MRNRLAKTVLAAAAVTAIALPAAAQARQGGDDPAGHVRHASHQTSTSASAHQHRHRHGRRHVRRADDTAAARRADDNGGARRGGADDGPNHR